MRGVDVNAEASDKAESDDNEGFKVLFLLVSQHCPLEHLQQTRVMME
jgi:hypothetical protein